MISRLAPPRGADEPQYSSNLAEGLGQRSAIDSQGVSATTPKPSAKAIAQEKHRAFWSRMDRCQTIAALEAEFLRERHWQHGAAQSTVGALLFSLRARGISALGEADTQERLARLSPAQMVECIGRIAKHRNHYPDADELLVAFADILE